MSSSETQTRGCFSIVGPTSRRQMFATTPSYTLTARERFFSEQSYDPETEKQRPKSRGSHIGVRVASSTDCG
jgi:hypothetical protein